ncbi:MAG: homoserine dehydrogenase, partial [Kiloniellales bacterium]
MNYQALFRRVAGKPVRVGLAGAGEFGRTFVAQACGIPGLTVPVLCDRDLDRAVLVARASGAAEQDITVCDSPRAAKKALGLGRVVVVPDGTLLAGLPFDLLLEATGDPEAGAANAEAAIRDGKHVAMVSKETDVVVGPELAMRAHRAGLVYTAVDGDQPSLLIGLVSWVRLLGLEIVAAGKGTEFDFVFDPAAGTLTANEISVAAEGFGDLWDIASSGAASVIAKRAEICRTLPQRTPPDLCEMGIVANATGLKPDTPELHAPIARTVELPDVLCPRPAGGLLGGSGRLDVFNCLRRPDEISFAGGVFVVVSCRDEPTWRLLRQKGIPVNGRSGHVLLHNPVHILGAEAPISVLSACLLGLPTGGDDLKPVCDLVAVAERPMRARSVLEIGERHAIDGLGPRLADARAVRGDAPLPYYMAAGARLRTDVPEGTVITADMVEPPEGSVLWVLRRAQDATFADLLGD